MRALFDNDLRLTSIDSYNYADFVEFAKKFDAWERVFEWVRNYSVKKVSYKLSDLNRQLRELVEMEYNSSDLYYKMYRMLKEML